MKSLPSVLSHLTLEEAKKAIFLKPVLGKEILPLCDGPKSTIMVARLLILEPNKVVPVHIHEKKEKIYICLGPGSVRVVIWVDNTPFEHKLHSDETIVIPPNTPHYIANLGFVPEHSRVIVVSSSQDARDIYWEEKTEELIKPSQPIYQM